MGKTIFLSSHILTELADVCTSVAILERGQLVVSGPIHDIARQLRDRLPPPAQAGTPAGLGPVAPPEAVLLRSAKLRVLGPPDAVSAALVGFPGVAKVTTAPGGVAVVAYTGDDHALAAIVRVVVMAGVPLAGVEPERNELERIFLEVTRGEVQ
jgi:ABC-2 type transport system ATP-binding protein